MKLKIALFNESFPPFIDGVANAVYNYARVINADLGSAFVVTPRLHGVYDDYPFKVIRYMSVPTPRKIRYPAGNPVSVPAIRAIRHEKPDIIHVHSPFSCSLLAKACAMGGETPVILTYHTKYEQDIDLSLPGWPLKMAAKRFVLGNVRGADEVWSVSGGCVESLREIGYRGKARVMENGVDFDRGKSDEQAVRRLRASLGIVDGEPVLLFVGRIMWYKNIKIVLDSARLAKGAGFKFKLVIVGDGLELPEIKEYALQNGMGEYTRFTGAVREREKLREYYTLADLFLFPSTYDTSGLVVKEAAACDTPSLLVRGSCAAEGAIEGFSGYFCDENAESAAMAVISALGNPDRLAEIGKNAGDYLHITWEAAIKRAYTRYEEIYRLWNSIKPRNRRNLFRRISEIER